MKAQEIWQRSRSPGDMFRVLEDDINWGSIEEPTPRRLRMTGYALCRQVEHLIPDGLGKQALDLVEDYSGDLEVSDKIEDLNEILSDRDQEEWYTDEVIGGSVRAIRWALRGHHRGAPDTLGDIRGISQCVAGALANKESDPVQWERIHNEVMGRNADLIREVFGDPWGQQYVQMIYETYPEVKLYEVNQAPYGAGLHRFKNFDPVPWLTDQAREMAEVIYQEKEFGSLPILADLLDEAGCRDHELLGHLRGNGNHVRGCWALDTVRMKP